MKILQAQARKGAGQRHWSFEDCLKNGWLQKATAKALANVFYLKFILYITFYMLLLSLSAI